MEKKNVPIYVLHTVAIKDSSVDNVRRLNTERTVLPSVVEGVVVMTVVVTVVVLVVGSVVEYSGKR